MFVSKSDELTRRAFLRRSGQLAAVGSASAYAMGLAGLADAAAFAPGDDYKALVCIFLYGGNDHANTLIPYDSANYERYAAIRGGGSGQAGIAIPHERLHATVLNPRGRQVLTDDMRLALAPTMPRMKALFDAGDMAPLLNVGPLLTPLTRAQYDNGNLTSFPRPPKLFSHNDQQSTWQAYGPEGAARGWGGRIGDLALSTNNNAMFTTINASGNAVFLSGQNAVPYQVSPGGAVLIRGLSNRVYGSTAVRDALQSLVETHHGHVLGADYQNALARSITYSGFVNDALEGSPAATRFGEGNKLAAQLSAVAQLIASRSELNVRRQVFLVSMGGFDNHDNLIGQHEGLLGALDEAVDGFQTAMAAIGMRDAVTTFTASDFGRTLASNGDGSDHGWGSHHFVVGGAVQGGRFYGRAPEISVEGNDQVGRGRLLPTASVDEYSATLARWFGVSEGDIGLVAPNLGRMATRDLGFMTPPD